MHARAVIVTLTALSLTGFSPPARPPIDAQQVIPKSWIPEKPLEQKEPEQETPKQPEITVNVTPKTPSAYRHPTAVDCVKTDGGPSKSTKGFVEAYLKARAQVEARRYEDAIASTEVAASYAQGSKEWLAIEELRVIAFLSLQNTAELTATLEAVLTTGCLGPERTAMYRKMLDNARQGQAPTP